jgi:hypothetical protein
MIDTQIERVLEIIKVSNIGNCFDRISELAADTAETPYGAVIAHLPDCLQFLGIHGFTVRNTFLTKENQNIRCRIQRDLLIDDLTVDPDFSSCELRDLPEPIHYLASVPLPLRANSIPITLSCVDPRAGIAHPADVLARLKSLALIAADEIRLIAPLVRSVAPPPYKLYLAAPGILEVPVPMVRENAGSRPLGDTRVVERFILSTLVPKRRLLQRKGEFYHSLFTWRRPIKREQIDSVRAIKLSIDDHFVDAVAREIADYIRDLGVGSLYRYVVPMPCGHSGEGCLACRLAQALAPMLGIGFAEGFEELPDMGSAHPQRSARMREFKTTREFDGPVILIDDIATTGTHIEFASRALKAVAPSVITITWIAD